jgi:hypothetical protein
MNRILIPAAVLCLAFPVAALAQSASETANLTPQLPAQQIHELIRSAHTPADYKQLAGYYHQQEAKYRAEAAAEKIERDRRAQVNAGLYQKYPRPVDSAQYLYESYTTDADQAALKAQHYEQLASGQNDHNQQFANAPQGKS